MQVSTNASSSGTIGFSNVGYWGFPVVADWTYKGSFWVNGGLNGNVTVCLTSLTNEVSLKHSHPIVLESG